MEILLKPCLLCTNLAFDMQNKVILLPGMPREICSESRMEA